MPNLLLVRRLALAWLVCYSGLVWAAVSPYYQDVMVYDYASLGFAAATSLVGAAARTILNLASDKVIVVNVWREASKDAVVALIGGAAVYVLLQGVAAFWPFLVAREMRLLLILSTGFGLGRWQALLFDLAGDVVARLRAWLRGGGMMPPPSSGGPSSVAAPLSDK